MPIISGEKWRMIEKSLYPLPLASRPSVTPPGLKRMTSCNSSPAESFQQMRAFPVTTAERYAPSEIRTSSLSLAQGSSASNGNSAYNGSEKMFGESSRIGYEGAFSASYTALRISRIERLFSKYPPVRKPTSQLASQPVSQPASHPASQPASQ